MRTVRADKLERGDVNDLYGKLLKNEKSPYSKDRRTLTWEKSSTSAPNDYPFKITRPSKRPR